MMGNIRVAVPLCSNAWLTDEEIRAGGGGVVPQHSALYPSGRCQWRLFTSPDLSSPHPSNPGSRSPPKWPKFPNDLLLLKSHIILKNILFHFMVVKTLNIRYMMNNTDWLSNVEPACILGVKHTCSRYITIFTYCGILFVRAY